MNDGRWHKSRSGTVNVRNSAYFELAERAIPRFVRVSKVARSQRRYARVETVMSESVEDYLARLHDPPSLSEGWVGRDDPVGMNSFFKVDASERHRRFYRPLTPPCKSGKGGRLNSRKTFSTCY